MATKRHYQRTKASLEGSAMGGEDLNSRKEAALNERGKNNWIFKKNK